MVVALVVFVAGGRKDENKTMVGALLVFVAGCLKGENKTMVVALVIFIVNHTWSLQDNQTPS